MIFKLPEYPPLCNPLPPPIPHHTIAPSPLTGAPPSPSFHHVVLLVPIKQLASAPLEPQPLPMREGINTLSRISAISCSSLDIRNVNTSQGHPLATSQFIERTQTQNNPASSPVDTNNVDRSPGIRPCDLITLSAIGGVPLGDCLDCPYAWEAGEDAQGLVTLRI